MQARISPTMWAAFRRLIAIAAGAAWLLASPAFAEPAMWVVKDEDSTIYLLGTFHLTKPSMHWWSTKIEAAFEDSDELWLETSDNGDMVLLQSLTLKHGIDEARPLSSKLGREDWIKVRATTMFAGLPISTVEQMRPWLAALTLFVEVLTKEGYDLGKGADKQLEDKANASGKIVKTFATLEQHMLVFAALSEQTEVAFLVRTLDEIAAGPQYMDQVANAWLAGDTRQLNALIVESMKAAPPELYETLLIRRNLDWSDTIAAMMKGSGTSFVAVGAGHLVGDRSVQTILTERGFTVAPY